jgi:hypothetical protein
MTSMGQSNGCDKEPALRLGCAPAEPRVAAGCHGGQRIA